MCEERLPMGKEFNCHRGHFDLPSEILEVRIFDDYLEFECEDGVYKACFHENDDDEEETYSILRKIK